MNIRIVGTPVGRPRHRRSRWGGMVATEKINPSHPYAAWRGAMDAAMLQSRPPGPPITGPVEVSIVLMFPRTSKVKGVQVPHAVKPDLDNVCNGILDALVRAGIIADDRLVYRLSAEKRYADRNVEPGAVVEFCPLAARG